MKKIVSIIFLLIVIFSCKNNNDLVSVKSMNNDLDSLVSIIEEIHINPYYNYQKESFYKKIDSVKSSLIKPLNKIEFSNIIMPIVAELNDGHTEFYKPYDFFYSKNPWIFPYNVETNNTYPYIRISEGIGEIPINSEILSINGINSESIISKLLKYESGEDISFRAKWVAYNFDYYLNTIYNIKSKCLIKYKFNNQIFEKEIELIKQSDFKDLSSKIFPVVETEYKPYSLEIIDSLKTAIINFESFENVEQFRLFIDSAFNMIKTNNLANLIIDIRENSGGNSEIGDDFLQYIADSDFNQYSDNTVMKVSQQLKNKYKKDIKEIQNYKIIIKSDSISIQEMNQVFSIPNGTIITCPYAKDLIKLENKKNRFKGNVYVLTSKETYSSAADFAQAIKAYKLGKIIGEETGGWIVCYGDIVEDQLPNSKLNIGVSYVKFINIGAKKDDWHGVIPDINISAKNSLKYTLNLIENE